MPKASTIVGMTALNPFRSDALPTPAPRWHGWIRPALIGVGVALAGFLTLFLPMVLAYILDASSPAMVGATWSHVVDVATRSWALCTGGAITIADSGLLSLTPLAMLAFLGWLTSFLTRRIPMSHAESPLICAAGFTLVNLLCLYSAPGVHMAGSLTAGALTCALGALNGGRHGAAPYQPLGDGLGKDAREDTTASSGQDDTHDDAARPQSTNPFLGIIRAWIPARKHGATQGGAASDSPRRRSILSRLARRGKGDGPAVRHRPPGRWPLEALTDRMASAPWIIQRAWDALIMDVIPLARRTGWALIGICGAVGAYSLIASWENVSSLAKAFQPSLYGSATLALANIAFIPTALVWILSFLVGTGFTVGQGTFFSAFLVSSGPMPSFPILGALPTSASGDRRWLLLAVVGVGAAVGMWFVRANRERGLGLRVCWARALAANLMIAVAVGALAVLASGGIGPGRLRVTGVAWLSLAIFTWVELSVGSFLGMGLAHPRLPELTRAARAELSSRTPAEESPFPPDPLDAIGAKVDRRAPEHLRDERTHFDELEFLHSAPAAGAPEPPRDDNRE